MFAKRRRQKVLRQYRQRRTTELPTELQPQVRDARRRRREPTPLPSWRELGTRVAASRSRVVSAFGAALCAALLLLLALAPQYYVHGASIQGNSRLSADNIYSASGINGQHVFQVDQAAVVTRLEQLPAVERARVAAALPNRIRILIEETPLALIWETRAGPIAIDARGRVAGLAKDATGLPRVRDEVGLIAPPQASLPVELVSSARSYADRFGGALVYREEAGFVHTTAEGWQVWLGEDASQVESQARRLEALRPRLAERARLRPVEMIDLRFEQWYYRMQGETP